MKKSILVLGAFIGLLATSCGKMLVVTPPNAIYDEQIQELLAQGGEQAEQIINSFASPLPKYFDLTNIAIGSGSANISTNTIQGINLMNSFQGNNLAYGCNATTTEEAYTGVTLYRLSNNLRNYIAPANGAHWYGYAYGMNQANLLLGYTKSLEKGNVYYKNDGAGRVVRAFCYMSLMEEYAPAYCNMTDPTAEDSGISLYKEYKPSQNAANPAKRSTAKETYEFIVGDLDTAITWFKNASVGYTKEDSQLEDIDLGVANFLKARAGLFIGDKKITTPKGEKSGWEICKEACDEIITNGGYGFIKAENWGSRIDASQPASTYECFPEKNAFVCVRKAVNPETILGYILGSTNTAGAIQNGILNIYGSYPESRYLMGRIDDRLYNKINDADCRKAAFVKDPITKLVYGSGSEIDMPSYCNVKFAARYGLTADGAGHTTADKAGDVEFCKFRYAEVVLMKAEAELALSGASAAKTALAGLIDARTSSALTVDTYMTALGMTDVKQFIKFNWDVEMWGENGAEYFVNKRMKVNIDRSGSAVHADAKGVNGDWNKWQDMTLAFPENEVLYNPNYAADATNTPAALN